MLVHEQRGDKRYENLIKKDLKAASIVVLRDFLMVPGTAEDRP